VYIHVARVGWLYYHKCPLILCTTVPNQSIIALGEQAGIQDASVSLENTSQVSEVLRSGMCEPHCDRTQGARTQLFQISPLKQHPVDPRTNGRARILDDDWVATSRAAPAAKAAQHTSLARDCRREGGSVNVTLSSSLIVASWLLWLGCCASQNSQHTGRTLALHWHVTLARGVSSKGALRVLNPLPLQLLSS